MEYRFADLVDLPGFQQVMQSWYSVAGVPTALLDAERTILCAVGWQDICTRFHHLPPQAADRCPYSDDFIFSHLHADDYVSHQCEHGLMNSAMPVIVKDEHVATLFMGQFLHAPPDEALFRQQAHSLGVDADAYLAALQQAPIIAEERLRVVMTAQAQLAKMLATLGWEHKRLLGTSATFNADLLRAQQHIALMLHTAQTASSTLEPDQVLEQVADALVAAVNVPYCGIYLLDTERGVLVPHVARGSLTDVGLYAQHLGPVVNSLMSEALAQQSPAVWYDAATDPRISQEMAQTWNIKSVLAVPIRVNAKVLGLALLSTSSDYRQFTPDEIELVWGIANSVALVVDNARLYAETRQHLAESQGLQRVASALLHKISPEEVLEIVCAEAQQLTGATGSAVLLVEDAIWLRVAYSSKTESAFFDRIPVTGSLAGISVRQNEPFLTNAPAGESYEYLQGERPKAFLSMPLHANGDVIGVLEVLDKPGGFVKDDIRIVSLFANQAAINIEHARLNQQAGKLAVIEERQRLARELHDSVVQSLYSIALYADAAALALMADKPDVTVSHLQELRDTARSAMVDMRLLIFELHPPALEEEGLITALRVRLASVEARSGVHAELEVEGERRLPIMIEQELYRIAQEALNNIMKHAQAQNVTLTVRFNDGTVSLQVRDDGTGFDPHNIASSGGMGLHSFAARAVKIGGHVTVDSQPGRGTTVTVHVAVPDGEAT
ncbi:MAG: PocR ligand-binding domain-containing protein [Anaerolineae bacterium]|jgi:signal transduction histidine kinase/ligand-binding sensor protein|nr:PocR ligand-binding domain-containing protein [Anaerolineae bacterium]